MNKLSKVELKKLTSVLEKLEAPMYRIYRKLSGGFAEAKMFSYDAEIIDVEFKFGVEDGEESRVYTEQHKINRKTMEIIN
jgi:hypothetical protein